MPPGVPDPRHRRLVRHLIQLLGYLFLLLGVIGLFLPFLQGILFILIGLVLLARTAPWATRLSSALVRRLPRLAMTARASAARVEARWSRLWRRR
jgi:uncharacterized membrane protein YbaN (DUF454 family)